MTEIARPRAHTSPIRRYSEMKTLLQTDGLDGMNHMQQLCNRESIQFGSLAEAYEVVLDSSSSTPCCNSSLSEGRADSGLIEALPVQDILLSGATLDTNSVSPEADRYVQLDLPIVIHCFGRDDSSCLNNLQCLMSSPRKFPHLIPHY